MHASLEPLLAACRSAEMTVCVLERAGRSRDTAGWAVNAFSVVVFSRSPLPAELPRPRFLTPKPLSSPTGSHKLLITTSVVSVAEAIAISESEGQIADPRAPSEYGPIESPGGWVGPFFVAADDFSTRSCVPPMHESFWLKERWQPKATLQNELGPKGVRWLHDEVLKAIGVSLAARRERIGNLLIVLPETRVKMRTKPSAIGKIGVEIHARPEGPDEFLVVTRGSRDGHVLNANAARVGPGLHVFPMLATVDHRDIELYDAQSGLLLERDAGVPLREMLLDMNVMSREVDLTFNFARPDGTPEPPLHVRTSWGSGQPSLAGGRAEWERVVDDIKRDEEGQRLQRERRFLVYRGGIKDRQRALDDIRQLLRSTKAFVKLWDPYFGHRDVAEFLPFVMDPTIPIQVLTSLTSTPEEEAAYKGASSAAADQPMLWQWKRRLLKEAVETLRAPNAGIPGFGALEVKSGGHAFHDRFLITHQQCWQLGCSFNQIGKVMSTILEFPYPAAIERQFDEAWKQATAVSS